MVDQVKYFAACLAWRVGDLRYEPAVWVVASWFFVSAQLGFWIDAAGPRLFEPGDLGGAIGRCVGVMLFWVPLAFMVVMVGAQRGGWSREGVARELALRLLATAVMVVALTAAALLMLLPAVATGFLTLAWADMLDVRWPALWQQLDYFSRGIWLGLAYAALCGLMTAICRSRALGGVLAVVAVFAELVAVSILTPPYSSLGWLDGLSPSAMYNHWLGDDLRSLGFMRNLAGLEDGVQGFLVMGGYLLVFCLLTWAVARRRGLVGAGGVVVSEDQGARARVFRNAMAGVFGLCVVVTLALGLLVAWQGPDSPRGTAWEYVNANLDEAASAAAGGLVEGAVERQRLARELRASWRSVIFPFQCDDVGESELEREPVAVTCGVMSLEYGAGGGRVMVPLLVEVHRERRLGFPVHRVDGVVFQGAVP